jgi:hypothetical protein
MTKLWCSWEADSPRPVEVGCPFKTWVRNADDKPGVLYALLSGVTADQAKARIQQFWPEAVWPGKKAKVFVNLAPEDFKPEYHQPALYENKLGSSPRSRVPT